MSKSKSQAKREEAMAEAVAPEVAESTVAALAEAVEPTPEVAPELDVLSPDLDVAVAVTETESTVEVDVSVPEAEDVVVEETAPVAEPKLVINYGKLAGKVVVGLGTTVVNGVTYNEVRLADGSTQLLSDAELEAQLTV